MAADPIDPDTEALRADLLCTIGQVEAIQLRLATNAILREAAEPEALDRVAQERAEILVHKLVEAGVTQWSELTAALRALFLTHLRLEQEREQARQQEEQAHYAALITPAVN